MLVFKGVVFTKSEKKNLQRVKLRASSSHQINQRYSDTVKHVVQELVRYISIHISDIIIMMLICKINYALL